MLGHDEVFAKNVIPENSQYVIQNIGIMGFMYFLFVTGVKMDLGVIAKAGKKHWVIAIAGVVIPHIIVWLVAFCIREFMDPELKKFSSIGGVISAVVITTFPVIYSVLRDMQLLSSEIGRVALTTVIISDFLGITVIITFEAIKQGESKMINALYYVVSVLFVSGLVIGGIPQVMQWINRHTPEGKPVEQKYITATLLGVYLIAFATDFIGAAIGNGPLWLGLAVPDGPPIGATLVHKSEVIMNDILMPFSYALVGLRTDLFAMSTCWSCLSPLFALAIMGFVVKLVTIVMAARAAPVFIDHTKQFEDYWDTNDEAVHNAIKLYEEVRTDCITMNYYTSVTPQRTMYQDICEIALLNKVGFIILPFHKKCIEDGNDFATALLRPGVQSANTNTLSHAPCSVGILACKDASTWGTLPTRVSHRMHRQFAMLFLGGPDAREALTLADRMVGHPDVSLIVVRFLASEYKGDNEGERKLDDGVVTWFWVKNERNDKVVYKEVVVSSGFETISAIQSLNESVPIDLWIVGRKNGINPTLLEGLSEWSDNPELGLVGDFLVSNDFDTSGSVLVVQQQVLRDQRASPWACY
ncbi:Cation/H(+) antiporter 24 [Bienertia sinuspersici]